MDVMARDAVMPIHLHVIDVKTLWSLCLGGSGIDFLL